MSTHEMSKVFGKRLHGLIQERGITQSELARKIWGSTVDSRGVKVARNRDRISQYVNGLVMPSPEVRKKIADALELAVDHLMQGIEAVGSGPRVDEAPADDMRMSPVAGEPGMVVLHFHQKLPRPVAMRIMAILASSSDAAAE